MSIGRQVRQALDMLPALPSSWRSLPEARRGQRAEQAAPSRFPLTTSTCGPSESIRRCSPVGWVRHWSGPCSSSPIAAPSGASCKPRPATTWLGTSGSGSRSSTGTGPRQHGPRCGRCGGSQRPRNDHPALEGIPTSVSCASRHAHTTGLAVALDDGQAVVLDQTGTAATRRLRRSSVALVPFFTPGVAPVVIPVALPEPRLVVIHQLEARRSTWRSSRSTGAERSCGTGPPWSTGSGSPSTRHTIHALPPVMSSSGRLVV